MSAVGAVAVGSSLTGRVGWAGQPEPRAFAPEIGVCTSLKNGNLLKGAGADYIEAGVRWLLVPDKPEDGFSGHLDAVHGCALPVRAANGFLPGSLKCTGPAADHAAVLRFAETAFERARRVGIEVIVFGSGGARTPPKDFDRHMAELQFVALLAKMAPLARKHDVVVVVEPLNTHETFFINTVPEGARLVEAVDHPNIRLLADFYHMKKMGEPARHLRDHGHLLRHIHIAEQDRRPPGTSGDDFRPYLQALKDTGYTGRMSLECRWKDVAGQTAKAVSTLRQQIAALS
jgi:sugar phosphate isomerase/epimerase